MSCFRIMSALVLGGCALTLSAQHIGQHYELKAVIPVEGRQGIAIDSAFYYVSGTGALYKYDKSGVLVDKNETPFRNSETANHFGDIDVHDGKIYCGIERFEYGRGYNIAISIYDTETLQWEHDLPWAPESGQVEVSGLAVDRKRNMVWMSDWVDSRYVYCYDLTTGQYHTKMQCTPTPYWCQGIFIADNRIIFSADDGEAAYGIADNLYMAPIDSVPYTGLTDGSEPVKETPFSVRLTADGSPEIRHGKVAAGAMQGRVTLFREMTDFRRAGEIEGLAIDPVNDDLVVLNNRGTRIVLGMSQGPLTDEGYTHEIHELYIYKKMDSSQTAIETDIEELKLKVQTLRDSSQPDWIDEAIKVYEKAIDTARGRIAPDKFADMQVDYAGFLIENNIYHKIGSLYDDALSTYRTLAESDPDKYKPDIAKILNNQANLHYEFQQYNNAEPKYIEALELYRRLARQNPMDFEPLLALNLGNMGLLHSETRQYKDSEREYLEALEIYRRFAKQNPEIYEQDVAGILMGLANIYYDTKRYKAAERKYIEALKIYRELAKQHPKDYAPDIAMALNTLAVLHSYTQQFDNAKLEYAEALDIWRNLSAQDHGVFDNKIALVLNNMANMQYHIHQYDEAEGKFTEAVNIYRKLVKQSPGIFDYDLACVLSNLAALHADIRHYDKAELEFTEAVNIKRELAREDPDVYAVDAAINLTNMAEFHKTIQRYDDAERDYLEILSIWENLAERNPDTYKQAIKKTKKFIKEVRKYQKKFKSRNPEAAPEGLIAWLGNRFRQTRS